MGRPGSDGYLVFDERDRAPRVVLGQVSKCSVNLCNSRIRSRRTIPELFFVHSDLTTLIQMDIIVG